MNSPTPTPSGTTILIDSATPIEEPHVNNLFVENNLSMDHLTLDPYKNNTDELDYPYKNNTDELDYLSEGSFDFSPNPHQDTLRV
ncbi:hypothetical protein GOP47_0029502 [Adiantum capillus-veneris]|nr:hypothetical protein GOP47_0029502 [Adiantum capillus-veneris]